GAKGTRGGDLLVLPAPVELPGRALELARREHGLGQRKRSLVGAEEARQAIAGAAKVLARSPKVRDAKETGRRPLLQQERGTRAGVHREPVAPRDAHAQAEALGEEVFR